MIRRVLLCVGASLLAGTALRPTATLAASTKAPPSCVDGQIRTVIRQGQGAGGRWVERLDFSLLPGRKACALHGYPGVEAYLSDGARISAIRETGNYSTVRLSAGHGAFSQLVWNDTPAGPTCRTLTRYLATAPGLQRPAHLPGVRAAPLCRGNIAVTGAQAR